jgi:hypothetical protein
MAMESQKKIQTNYYYGHDPLIKGIYNRAISDEFPSLFKGFWDVYETWYYHQDRWKEERSSFLVDSSLPPEAEEKFWKYERFGNYLFGAYLSVYFSWESLQAVKAARNLLVDPQNNLAFIRQVSGFARHLFTALDAISCCIYIVEDKIPSGCMLEQGESRTHLGSIGINNIWRKIGKPTNYGPLHSLPERAEFKYLSEYRNLVTHRPFYQFGHSLSSGLCSFPENLAQLDSITQRKRQYLQSDVGSYLATAFEIIVADFEALLLELDTRYRKRI